MSNGANARHSGRIMSSFGFDLLMKWSKRVLLIAILPWLSGCLTSSALRVAKTPVYRNLPDNIFRVERAVITEDEQLVIYLDGYLTNSSHESQFTVRVPLKQIETQAKLINSAEYSNGTYINYQFGLLNLSRDAIYTGWSIPAISANNLKIVPLGTPAPVPSIAYNRESAYVQYAKQLSNTTQTLYIAAEPRDPPNFPLTNEHGQKAGQIAMDPTSSRRNGWPAELEFIFVDASSKRRYTIIRIEKIIVPDNWHRADYCLVPLTVPLDIATAPIQLIGLLLYAEMLRGLGSTQ